jgi:uncharacterized protein
MNHLINELALLAGGLIAGILAGLLGSGGGVLCVPLLIALNYSPIQALGTSCLAVSVIAISGSIQNSRMGYFSPKRVIGIGIPALVMTPIATYAVSQIQPYLLLTMCGVAMLLMIYLVELRRQLVARGTKAAAKLIAAAKPTAIAGEREPHSQRASVVYASQSVAYAAENSVADTNGLPHWLTSMSTRRLATGSLAGLFAGALGGGSGSLLVPLQMLVLGESIKAAIQTSIGVNIITSAAAWVSHASRGNVLFLEGFLLGVGGFVGAQIGTRYLPKLPDQVVKVSFNTMIVLLAAYILWKAWESYNG